MKNLRILLPILIFVFLIFPGCQNEQTGQPVSLADILFGSSSAVKEFQESEVYELLPGNVKGIIAIVAIGLTALGNVVLAFKNNGQKKIITELVLENPDLKTNSLETKLKLKKIISKIPP